MESRKLTQKMLTDAMYQVYMETPKPNTMIVSPKFYAYLQWKARVIKPWPVDFEMLLFPRWTRLERKIRRYRNRLKWWWRGCWRGRHGY